jgi:hypothetical protein
MTRITLDAELLSRLNNLIAPLELCDTAGRVVARVIPTPAPDTYGPLEPQISRAEIQRRKQDKGRTYTTAEVLAHF